MDDRARLARVEERLETLQEEVAQLAELLRARQESGQRTARGGWSTQASSAESPPIPGRSDLSPVPGARGQRSRLGLRPRAKPPRDQDPIGCVEIGVERLAEDMRALSRVLPGTRPGPGPWDTSTVRLPTTPPRDTSPSAPEQGPRSGDQTDSETGDDMLGDLAPSEGPGGPGPHKKKPVKPPDDFRIGF